MHCFNPRVHGGRDFIIIYKSVTESVSIHASTGDATSICTLLGVDYEVSIHASTGDATQSKKQHDQSKQSYNPRVPGGRDKVRP